MKLSIAIVTGTPYGLTLRLHRRPKLSAILARRPRNTVTMGLSLSTNIVIISIVFSALAALVVFMRFRARVLQGVKFGIDDYTILPAAVSAVHRKLRMIAP